MNEFLNRPAESWFFIESAKGVIIINGIIWLQESLFYAIFPELNNEQLCVKGTKD